MTAFGRPTTTPLVFGFSLQKLLVLAAIVAAVWYGFKLISRLDEARRADPRLRSAERPGGWSPFRPRGKPKAVAEEMVQCSVCDAFVPSSHATSCGRSDCPY